MATAPFDINVNVPADTDAVSVFPAAERAFRDIVEDALAVEHDMNTAGSSARHKFGVGNNAARDAITDWVVGSLWLSTTTSPATLQRVVSVGPVVWENVAASTTGLAVLSAANAFTGANTFSTTQTINAGASQALRLTGTTANQFNFEVEVSEDGSATGPILLLERISASPAASDFLAEVRWRGRDSAGNATDYATIFGQIVDPTDASEDGRSVVRTLRAGAGSDWYFESGALRHSTVSQPTVPGGFNTAQLQVNGNIPFLVLQRLPQYSKTQQAAATNTIPADLTTPLSSEGAQAFSQAITPKDATSTIRIHGVLSIGASSASVSTVAALFNGTTCIAVFAADNVSNGIDQIRFEYEEVSGSTSARTYSIRYGSASGTTALNRNTAATVDYGNQTVSSFVVEEILQ